MPVLMLLGYVTLVLKWEDFADYDDAFFTLSTLRGINLVPPVWPAIGRFFPLGRQEFNFVRHLTNSVAGYHAVPLTELLIVCCILCFLDGALSITARLSLTAIFLVVPSVVTSFTGLVFSEFNVVFWLACMLVFVKFFEKHGSTAAAVAAAISAQNMIYYKETAFLVVVGFGAGRLVLRCRRADSGGWDRARLNGSENRLDLCLITLGVIFLAYYEVVMFHHPGMQYASQFQIPWDKAILYYLKLDFLAILLVLVALTRGCGILRGRLIASPFWDGLALGGVACYAAYLHLRLCMPYYLAPVDFIAVLYVGRYVVLSWHKLRLTNRMMMSALAVVVLLQCMSLSAFRLYERENIIRAKAELATTIAARTYSDSTHVQRLFFPFSTPYIITEFASYLTYRHIRVEGFEPTAKSSAPRGVAIVSPAFTGDGRCLSYAEFLCHAAGSGPAPGDLIIELPDDLEPESAASRYRAGGDVLFSYQPRPRILQSIYSSYSYFHIISLPFWFKDLPDRWLQASISQWK
ncbi:MAG: hypothetical protein WA192_07150 [Candidatus Acidiferrales bacterium]